MAAWGDEGLVGRLDWLAGEDGCLISLAFGWTGLVALESPKIYAPAFSGWRWRGGGGGALGAGSVDVGHVCDL